jgi:hypothetical protein
MGAKPRVKPVASPVSIAAAKAKLELGHADTVMVRAPSPAERKARRAPDESERPKSEPEARPAPTPRTAKTPPPMPGLFRRAAGAVTRVFRRPSPPYNGNDPTMVISAAELPSLIVEDEDEG